VQNRIENQEIRSDRFASVNRVISKQYDVPLFERHIDHHRPLRDIRAAIEQPRCEQIPLITETQNYAGTLIGRNDIERVAELIVRDRRVLPRLHRRARHREETRIELCETLNLIGVIRLSAAGRARCATCTAATTTAAAPAA
jgi:hypothetical protein